MAKSNPTDLLYPGLSFWSWIRLGRGTLCLSSWEGTILPMCDKCGLPPEKFEMAHLLQPYHNPRSNTPISHQILDVKIKVECHGETWCVKGSDAKRLLDVIGVSGL